jgi:3-deoxy-D-manno-octulosonic-acid transferase
MSVLWSAYRMFAPALGAIAPAARVFTSPNERPLWGERLGRVTLEGGCDAWVHAASLGEAVAARPLISELRALAPHAPLYLTATTRTGRARLQGLGAPASLAPIDSPQAVARFFAGVAPRRVFIVETELWPHWLMRARATRVPVAIVSARLSEKSVKSYLRLGGGLRELVAGLSAVLCQGSDDRRRWLAIGAQPDRTVVVGNLKADALPSPAPSRQTARAALGLVPQRALLVLGSVRPGEVRVAARAWNALPETLRREWQVVAVPRHARANRDLFEEAAAAGIRLARFGREADAPDRWRWDERVGVLNDYYAAADVAFVGGSLVPFGGHNPLEPAACGTAVITGLHHASQADAVGALLMASAIRVVENREGLSEALATLLGDAQARAIQGAAGLRVVAGMRGAARRAVQELAARRLWPVGP